MAAAHFVICACRVSIVFGIEERLAMRMSAEGRPLQWLLGGAGISPCATNRSVRITTEVWNQVRNWMGTGPDGRLRPTLRQGSRGPSVMEMQTRLNKWLSATRGSGLAPLKVDGIFGPKTNQVVLAFQRAFGR